MSNLVNLVKSLLGLMLDVHSFKAKNRAFKFDDQYMNTFKFDVRKIMLELVQCSIKWCSTHH